MQNLPVIMRKLATLATELETRSRNWSSRSRVVKQVRVHRTSQAADGEAAADAVRTKSEKIIIKLDQLELHLEEMESARAELETAMEASIAGTRSSEACTQATC